MQAQEYMEPPMVTGNLEALNREMEQWTPRKIISWATELYDPTCSVLGTGFGTSGVVLSHLASTLPLPPRFFYLDTGVLFQETYVLKSQLETLLGVRFERVATALSPDEQHKATVAPYWHSNPDRCCFIRKVLPLRNYLADKRVWFTGLRRDQSATRQEAPLISWDATNKVLKINPLVHWSEKDVWRYISDFELPYNPLHDAGYPSIGCQPCTRPVNPDSEPRSGRWAGRPKTECGIHYALTSNGAP